MQEGQEIFAVQRGNLSQQRWLRKRLKTEGYGPQDTKNLVLQFQPIGSIRKEELEFITNTMRYQNSKKETTCPSNFIQILDTFQYENKYFTIIYELGESNLYYYLCRNQQKMDDQQKYKICLDIAYSIYYLHQNELVYLNLKPEKFLKCDNSFKLIDFRNVKQKMALQTFQISTPLLYIPEMTRNSQNYLENANIWMIGCLFYEVINGKTLFNYKTQKLFIEASQDYQKYLSYIDDQINLLNCMSEFKQLLFTILDQRQNVSIKRIVETLKQIVSPTDSQIQEIFDEKKLQEQHYIQQLIENQINEKNVEIEKLLKCQMIEQYSQMQDENQIIMHQFIKEFRVTKQEIQEEQLKFKVQFNDQIYTFDQQLQKQGLEMEEQLKCLIVKQHKQIQDEQQFKIQQLKEELQQAKSETLQQQLEFQNFKNQISDYIATQTLNQQKLHQELQSALQEYKSAAEITQNQLQTQTSIKLHEVQASLDSLIKRIDQIVFQQKQTEIQMYKQASENTGTVLFYIYLFIILIFLKLILA